MSERIIPIKRETDEEIQQAPVDVEEKISKPMEEMIIEQKKPTVQVKTRPRSIEYDDYLKEYDVFEERIECTLPNANVPEKIILVIDPAQDENYTSFVADNNKYSPLSMLRRTIHLFIKLKLQINKNHQFAIVVLNENSATWLLNFTSDLRKLNTFIERLKVCEVEDTFNMNSVFDEIIREIQMPEVIVAELPPPYIIRTVIFYGRSYSIPQLKVSEEIKKLLENPYFICDVLMTHEPIDPSNHCSKIFESLQNIDKKGLAYFTPVCRDSKRLHNSIGKLLSHPLQRPIQILQKI